MGVADGLANAFKATLIARLWCLTLPSLAGPTPTVPPIPAEEEAMEEEMQAMEDMILELGD